MNFAPLIARKADRFRELEAEISAPNLYDDPRRARETLREHTRLKQLLADWELVQKLRTELSENQALTKGDDAEFAEMAAAEIPALEARIAATETAVQYALLPPDPNEDRDAIVEIRAGTGGDEAALFAADLHRMYTRFAETHGFKIEPLEASPGALGGLREVIFKVTGDQVFRTLRYESGVHRVQRVPATEAQGRIHTSTATVAVLPEAEEVDLELKPDEIRIEVCRAGGPGGQGVNTTDSAVQVMHIPTGTIVRCQDGRSQQKNKEKALTILRSRLLEVKQREEHETDRHGRPLRENPHLQLFREPHQRSPHQTHPLQPRPLPQRRHLRNDLRPAGRRHGRAAGGSQPRGVMPSFRVSRAGWASRPPSDASCVAVFPTVVDAFARPEVLSGGQDAHPTRNPLRCAQSLRRAAGRNERAGRPFHPTRAASSNSA
jgi:peptide chain release factor 1